MNCPQCNRDVHQHNNSVCEFRYFHDEINEQYGWIHGSLTDLIPGEVLSDEKAIIHYKESVQKEPLNEELDKAA